MKQNLTKQNLKKQNLNKNKTISSEIVFLVIE